MFISTLSCYNVDIHCKVLARQRNDINVEFAPLLVRDIRA